MKQEILDELVRDLTKVGSISKSEARRRIQDYAMEFLKEYLDGQDIFTKAMDNANKKL